MWTGEPTLQFAASGKRGAQNGQLATNPAPYAGAGRLAACRQLPAR